MLRSAALSLTHLLPRARREHRRGSERTLGAAARSESTVICHPARPLPDVSMQRCCAPGESIAGSRRHTNFSLFPSGGAVAAGAIQQSQRRCAGEKSSARTAHHVNACSWVMMMPSDVDVSDPDPVIARRADRHPDLKVFRLRLRWTRPHVTPRQKGNSVFGGWGVGRGLRGPCLLCRKYS